MKLPVLQLNKLILGSKWPHTEHGCKPCLTTVDISTVVPPDANVIHLHRTNVAPSLLEQIQVVTAFHIGHPLVQIVIDRDFHIIGHSVTNIWYEQLTSVSPLQDVQHCH